MKRYERWPGGAVMLVIDEGDPVPSEEEIAESDRLREAIAAGDPRVEVIASDDRGVGCGRVLWSPVPLGRAA
jgi:hypothetical protein